MAKSTKGKKPDPKARRVVGTYREARRDFDILDTLECGIVLQGSEVKSLREAHVRFANANGWIRNYELFLLGVHIPQYANAGAAVYSHNPDRERKLLAHKEEILRWKARVDQEHLAIVPLQLYFKDGRIKVEMGLGRGKKQHDKRQELAKRDALREAQRAMARAGRGD